MWYVQKEVFEPEEICISEEISDKAYNSGVHLTKTLDTSPPTYQIKRKRASDLADETKLLKLLHLVNPQN